MFQKTRLDPEGVLLELYLEALSSYSGRDVADACKELLTTWEYQEAPKPAKVVSVVLDLIRERKREAGASKRLAHPQPRFIGELDGRGRRSWLADHLCPDRDREDIAAWVDDVVRRTSGMPTGNFMRVCQKLARSGAVPIERFWEAFDQIEAEDRQLGSPFKRGPAPNVPA